MSCDMNCDLCGEPSPFEDGGPGIACEHSVACQQRVEAAESTKMDLCDLCKTATGPLSDSHPGISCLVVTAHLKMVAEMNQKAAHPYRDVQARPPERLSFDVPHETLREFLAWYAKEKLSIDIRDYKEVQISWSRNGDGTTDALIVNLYGRLPE